MFFKVYVWGPHGGWAMLSGLVHTYVFNFYWFCTFLYIPVPSLNKDFIIIIIIIIIKKPSVGLNTELTINPFTAGAAFFRVSIFY